MADLKMVVRFESGCPTKPETLAKLLVGKIRGDSAAALVAAAVEEVRDKLETRPVCNVFGYKRQPRDLAFFGTSDTYGYFYSGTCAVTNPIGPKLRALLEFVNTDEELKRAIHLSTARQHTDAPFAFNGILVNRYNDGNNHVGRHSDSEAGLDPSAGVVIITYNEGDARKLRFTVHPNAPSNTQKFKHGREDVTLEHNGLLVMAGPAFQRSYKHELPKEAGCRGARYSFTFRVHRGKEHETNYIKTYEKNLPQLMAASERFREEGVDEKGTRFKRPREDA
jgi:alkylated DNA repair dioxygenase AlkB